MAAGQGSRSKPEDGPWYLCERKDAKGERDAGFGLLGPSSQQPLLLWVSRRRLIKVLNAMADSALGSRARWLRAVLLKVCRGK